LAQLKLHEYDIEVAAELKADLGEVRDFYEPKLDVEGEAGFLLGVDPGDKRAIA
jgi:hypothetical protein